MPHGFVWYELVTPDPEGAARFYGDVIGWEADTTAFAATGYTLVKTQGREVAGIMAPPPDAVAMGAAWGGYVGVADVDAAAQEVLASGGRICRPPAEIPDVGRFSVVSDPQGAMFTLFRGNREAAPPLPYMTPGTVGWHELHTTDWEAAWQFYSGQFDWAQGAQMEMGPMGTYQMYKLARDMDEGAMLTDRQAERPHWLFYFAVPGIAEAMDRIRAGGGTVLMGPMEVPGPMWIVIAKDPQGAAFALVGPQREGTR